MMYFSVWMILVLLSLWAAMCAFIWALKSGQFADQSRARYLALSEDLPLTSAKAVSTRRRPELVALVAILVIGFAAILATIVLSLCRMKG